MQAWLDAFVPAFGLLALGAAALVLMLVQDGMGLPPGPLDGIDLVPVSAAVLTFVVVNALLVALMMAAYQHRSVADVVRQELGQKLLVNVALLAMAPLIVQLSFLFAYAVLTEATLSFLGLGAVPPTPTWGNIMAEGRQYLVEAPWIISIPGVALMLTVLGLNLLGDGLRDVLDPRLRIQP